MKVQSTRAWTALLHCLLISGLMVEALEPVSTSLLLGTGAALLGRKLYKYFYETCNENWVHFNATSLKIDLNKKLFGQHIATNVILNAVTGFMNNKNPKKPLILSFHGWTGTGKNFASQIIAENIYKKGMLSSFVHLFTATAHFPHQKHINTYKTQLQEWIRGNVSICPRSMFIFDEMDKMHPGLVDSIKPHLDFYENLNGVSYNQAIFIFLSNAGGKDIVQVALDFWKNGRERREIKLKDLEAALSLSVFNNKNSGFWHTSLIEKNLVDFFVQFLPLEYKHIIQCGMAEMANKGYKPNEKKVQKMARDLSYFPKEERVFSQQGCKVIPNRLHLYIS